MVGTVALAVVSSSLANAQGGDIWETRAPMPTPRRLLAAAAEAGKVYTFGGCGSPCFQPPFHVSAFEETRVEVYDPERDRWEVRSPMPTILFGAAAAAPGDGRIYTFGGFVSPDVVQEYDPGSDSWRLRSSMPTPRHGLATVALGGNIYVLGGSDGRRALGTLEVYDPATDSWSRGAPMPTPRVFLAAAAVGGRIYAIGGSPDCCGDAATDAVEVYDPATDTWRAAASLPVAQQVSAAADAGGAILTFGGFIPGQGAQGRTFEYDPESDRWTERATMPTARDQSAAARVNPVFVVGGSVDCHCRALPTNESYRPREPPTPTADLTIEKDDGVDEVADGVRVTYRITVRNRGPAPVEGAAVSDRLPPSLRDVTWTCRSSPEARCTDRGTGDLDDRVDLPPGGSATYTVTGIFEEDGAAEVSGVPERDQPTELVNTATVTAPEGVEDPVPGNDSATDVDAVVSAAGPPVDVALAKAVESGRTGVDFGQKVVEGGPTEVDAGDELAYLLTVTNRGPGATRARVLDPLPRALRATARWTCEPPPGGSCTQATGSGDVATVVELPTGSSATIRIVATVADDFLGLLVNSASARALGRLESDPSDNSAFVETTVFRPQPGLHAAKTARVSGSEVTFTLVLLNSGPGAQGDNPGPELLDTLPEALSLRGATASRGTVQTEGNTVRWIGDLPARSTVTIGVTARIEDGSGGGISNQATVFFDLDGAGENESSRSSDDPTVAGFEDPTRAPSGVLEIPTLPWAGLVALAFLLVAGGLACLGGWRP